MSKVRISQRVKDIIMCNLRDTVFNIKTNVLQNFHLSFSVPLIESACKSGKVYGALKKTQHFDWNSCFFKKLGQP